MTKIASAAVASTLLALAGCSAPVGAGHVSARDEALGPLSDDEALAAVAESVAAAPEGGAETPAVQLSLRAVDALSGDAVADVEVCRIGFEAARGFSRVGSHVAAMAFVDDRMSCDEGANLVAADREVLLAAHAPGYPVYALHVTSYQEDQSLEVSLLSDAALDAAYAGLGEEREAFASSVVVETPHSGLRVTLVPLAVAIAPRAPSTYLDATGGSRDHSIGGGKALFTNVAPGPYEVRIEHDALRCAILGGWQTPDGAAVWAIDPFEVHVEGIHCSALAGS